MSKKQKQRERQTADEDQAAPAAQESSATADVDALLDEIDSVLEVNAAEFVASYVQQGGE